MITVVLWILTGVLVGCFANAAIGHARRRVHRSEIENVVVGGLGGAIGGAVFDPQIAPGVLSTGSVLTALAGALLLLLLTKIATVRSVL